MSKFLRRAAALTLSAAALLVSACAPTTRFEWGNYEGALYAYAKKPETRPQYRAALESAIQKGRQTNRIAPGLQAELGYVLLEDGDKAGARVQFEGEMHDFPESKAFLKGVVDRLDGGVKKAEVAS
jgi:hypothetical protein